MDIVDENAERQLLEIEKKTDVEHIMELFFEHLDELYKDKFYTGKKSNIEKMKKVMSLRYGFYDGKCWTLEEISKELNVSKEMIRNLEAKSLRIIRSNLMARANQKKLNYEEVYYYD